MRHSSVAGRCGMMLLALAPAAQVASEPRVRGGLQRYIESDFAKTIATLERMIVAIEAYAEIESAAEEPVAPPPTT